MNCFQASPTAIEHFPRRNMGTDEQCGTMRDGLGNLGKPGDRRNVSRLGNEMRIRSVCPRFIVPGLFRFIVQISKLQQARKALTGGREAGNGLRAAATSEARKHRGPRKMSAEARSRIAAAQRARWAKVRAQKKK